MALILITSDLESGSAAFADEFNRESVITDEGDEKVALFVQERCYLFDRWHPEPVQFLFDYCGLYAGEQQFVGYELSKVEEIYVYLDTIVSTP